MILSPTGKLMVRGSDPVANSGGLFGASRFKTVNGERIDYKHKGVDLTGKLWSVILGSSSAKVTKIGIAYPKEFRFHSLHMVFGIGPDDYRIKLLYVWPVVQVKEMITRGQTIALLEDLRVRYKGVTPHTHMAIWKNGKLIDPLPLLDKL